jgi:hypothetical protein
MNLNGIQDGVLTGFIWLNGPMKSSCEDGYDHLRSAKEATFIHQLSDIRLSTTILFLEVDF